MSFSNGRKNIEPHTVAGFGDEWRRFDQSPVTETEGQEQFERYFRIFPWERLPRDAIGFDMGCGSGRWAMRVAPRVGQLLCVDASREALNVARRNLSGHANCELVHASVDEVPIADASMDFGYSLGVLHHVPDTVAAVRVCAQKLKPGSPLLLYLYYAFDNRPWWYRLIWKLTDSVRAIISRLPHGLRFVVTQVIAATVYWPLARTAKCLEGLGWDVETIPLAAYRDASLYTMRTDALDRFGTRLERRFTAEQIEAMMRDAGLEQIRFSESVPYWCVVGIKS